MNPLMIGAARGNLALVYMCIRHGAMVDAVDRVGSNPAPGLCCCFC